MAETSLADRLQQKHPDYVAVVPRMKRWRAFMASPESAEEKMEWLPKGWQESKKAYATRIQVTEELGWTRPALRRMSGSLAKHEPERDYAEGQDFSEWDKDVDLARRNINQWYRTAMPEVLGMGQAYAVMDRERATVEVPTVEVQEGRPFLQLWTREEGLNWSLDPQGRLDWMVLSRMTLRQASPLEDAHMVRVFLVLDRMRGEKYEQVVETEGQDEKDAVLVDEWTHGLGMVPVVPIYALYVSPMNGDSYIDDISKGDRRGLQLESDQSYASFLHGSPVVKGKIAGELDEVGWGTQHFLHLDPEKNEDIEYLELDTAGMDVREKVLERTHRQSLNSAGIDPRAVSTGEVDAQPQSGVSIAMSFSTAEVPLLSSLTDELDRADMEIHELRARYQTVGTDPVSASVFEGTVARHKRWDMLAERELVDLTDVAWSRVKSPTWKRITAQTLASRLPGGVDPEDSQKIREELQQAQDAGLYDDVEQPQMDGGEDDQPPPGGGDEPDTEPLEAPAEDAGAGERGGLRVENPRINGRNE